MNKDVNSKITTNSTTSWWNPWKSYRNPISEVGICRKLSPLSPKDLGQGEGHWHVRKSPRRGGPSSSLFLVTSLRICQQPWRSIWHLRSTYVYVYILDIDIFFRIIQRTSKSMCNSEWSMIVFRELWAKQCNGINWHDHVHHVLLWTRGSTACRHEMLNLGIVACEILQSGKDISQSQLQILWRRDLSVHFKFSSCFLSLTNEGLLSLLLNNI